MPETKMASVRLRVAKALDVFDDPLEHRGQLGAFFAVLRLDHLPGELH